MPALNNLLRYVGMTTFLMLTAIALCLLNQHRAKSAVIYFQELAPEAITTLGLVWVQPSSSRPAPAARRNRLNQS
jgi:hypothetical protein